MAKEGYVHHMVRCVSCGVVRCACGCEDSEGRYREGRYREGRYHEGRYREGRYREGRYWECT